MRRNEKKAECSSTNIPPFLVRLQLVEVSKRDYQSDKITRCFQMSIEFLCDRLDTKYVRL